MSIHDLPDDAAEVMGQIRAELERLKSEGMSDDQLRELMDKLWQQAELPKGQ